MLLVSVRFLLGYCPAILGDICPVIRIGLQQSNEIQSKHKPHSGLLGVSLGLFSRFLAVDRLETESNPLGYVGYFRLS